MSVSGADFLYPFLDTVDGCPDALLADLAESAAAKWADSEALCDTTVARECDRLRRVGAAVAERARAGGRIFTVGNGGSATDAAAMAALFAAPPAGVPLPARSLADDPAVLTALANDIGFANVFARQLAAVAVEGDVVVGFSTSGDSQNVVLALEAAATRGMLVIGFAGYDGGRMASASVGDVIVVPSQSVHRIQEAQGALVHALWRAVQGALADAGARA